MATDVVGTRAILHEGDGSPLAGRITYAICSLLSLSLLVACFAVRTKNLRLYNLRQMNTSRGLVIGIYLCGILFIISASLLQFGLTLSTLSRCKAAIILCLVFYVGGKVLMYAFLCERMHTIRQNYLNRWQDVFWGAALSVVLAGFGVIAILSFIYPVYNISSIDGRCRIGLPFKITLPLLIYDILVNSILTFIFFYLVRPYMRKGLPNFTPVWIRRLVNNIRTFFSGKEQPPVLEAQPNALDQRGLVERVAWKSLLGCGAVLCSTVANLSVLFYMKGYEQGWLCFTLCTIDVSWGAIVVHQLTSDPTEVDSRNPALVSRRATNPRPNFELPAQNRVSQ